ncbi:probable palmitoyltransferase ZDHHC4 [Rhinatrema bivittatum]|uniref:probable palmitoyltransferase ZDHHC4 n=1 Tax=Rhinatrema bivittatum TaxID=194408 RepID=UPI00112E0042|nr:probable palmitoyltransferase ZDHHC4 [Rhinatrema bivittatum]XP_029432119.1 probable palmitoyltransferase ZDHHC4 [Rhinatrema bivittatum]XP_029432120.1 probable palmitoyltransferase ZDHHC4 [Rhinatrema bivittatum]XP_029432122.1 probable palmitoyltransferase ZDHHC4 [Rhinatrema bivittatum]XP_029432123.1 probable palmitoyltransferase ZDHHC4 [Rhinatrema bivittatum]XP_029432124.1 probable palmitoyltransferase ZDHHC4 [Rhinatrema bivittatum]XP_029432125.1 probable palmitoyltransferase ZDHHC4 [Rhinat
MDFLWLFTIYSLLVLLSVFLICYCSGRNLKSQGRILRPVSKIVHCIVPPWLQQTTQNTVHRLCHTRTLLFVLLHLVLDLAVFAEYSWEIFGYCLELEFCWFYLVLPYGLLTLNIFFFFLSSVTDPGTITKSNLKQCLQTHCNNEETFLQHRLCPTCNLRKPARSKHCRVCNRCVQRFDHHCVWVNNCIGALNARYFLPYLLTLTVLAAYLAALTAAFLLQVVILSGITLGGYQDAEGQQWPMETQLVIQHLFLTFPRIVFLLGFLLLLWLLAGGYTCFMFYLLLTNQTSNEWFMRKREGCAQCRLLLPHAEHSAYKNRYSKGILENLREVFQPNLQQKKRK